MHKFFRLYILCAIFFIHPALSVIAERINSHNVPKTSDTLKVDAILDEPLWVDSLQLEMKYEVRPGENIPAPVETTLYITYNTTHLYLAFYAKDPDPSQIRARYSDRDKIWDDDWLGVMLDTFNDERRCYDFICNPLGIQCDLIETPEGGGDSWDAIWDSAGRIVEDGYIVEISVPFSSLRFPGSDGEITWGLDAVRSYPRSLKHHIGLFPRDRNDNCYLCQADKIKGFKGITPGKNIEITPTVSSVLSEKKPDFPSGGFEKVNDDTEFGITARWGVTPNIMLGATYNPDFSNIEADSAQLNINNQFAIFYQEKRPFFLEGSDFFNTRMRAVHTRTLANPEWGAKVSGKEGANAIGFFHVEDALTNIMIPGKENNEFESLDLKSKATVLRYRRDIRQASTMGMLLTHRTAGDYSNKVGGIDGDFRINKKDRIRFQFLKSETSYPVSIAENHNQPQGAFKGDAFDFHYFHGTKTWDWYFFTRQVDKNFRADLGFMPQVNYKNYDMGWGHTWNRDPGSWFTMLNVGSGYEFGKDFDGNDIFKALTFWFDYQGPLQTNCSIFGNLGKKTYQNVEFDNRFFIFFGNFTPLKDVKFGLEFLYGDGIDYTHARQGKRIRIEGEAEYNIGKHLRLELNHTHARMKVECQRLYTADITEFKTIYQFNKRTFLRLINQYVNYDYNKTMYLEDIDEQFRHLFNQLLFSYKINPQTVFFAGYSDNYFNDMDMTLQKHDRTFFVKIGYAWVR